MVGSVIMYRL